MSEEEDEGYMVFGKPLKERVNCSLSIVWDQGLSDGMYIWEYKELGINMQGCIFYTKLIIKTVGGGGCKIYTPENMWSFPIA